MKVSVVIPCHDAEAYLAQTIGSVLDQTRPAHEIIVVDDRSSDRSRAIARAFETRVPARVRVAEAHASNACRTRNLGAMLATGEALMFLDADDVLGPTALEALVDALALAPGALAACAWYRLERHDDVWQHRPPSCAPRQAGQDALAAWLTGWYYPPCAVLWSRVAFDVVGRWDEQALVNQDGDLMMRALATGLPLQETRHGAAYYRRRPDGETSLSGRRLTPEGLAGRLRVIRKIASWLEERGSLEPYRMWLGEAIDAVARDAGQEHELLRDAWQMRRVYGPRWRHVAARLVRRALSNSATVHVPDAWAAGPVPHHASRAEVQYGLRWAHEVTGVAATAPNAANVGVSPVRQPAVSVVIPTYNRAHVLNRALASVTAQTFEDFEVLVIDDGSTDDTAAAVAACGDSRVHLRTQPQNAGVGAARNRGIREARGEFIAFLDSDDEWMPEKLERQVALFCAQPERVGLTYTGVETVRGAGDSAIHRPEDRGDVHREMLWRNVIHGASSVMIRRAVPAAAGYFDEDLSAIEDYEYWLRITRFFDVDFVPEPLLRYHDAQSPERRSLALRANLDARWWFYRRYAAEMRRAGVAQLFFLKTIRWVLSISPDEPVITRRLAAQAVLEAPLSRMAWAMFVRTTLPAAGQLRWVRRHAALD